MIRRLILRLADWLIARATQRAPDFTIGRPGDPYLHRWWVIPRNRVFNVYLHQFVRSDDDRALHDHPWVNCSILLRGSYVEHTIAAGGIHYRRQLEAGDIRLRLSGKLAHRVELLPAFVADGKVIAERPCWTLFITGPRYRAWGFHCDRGWVHWEVFTASDDRGAVGRGCEP